MGLFNHALARSVNGPALIGGRALIVNVVDDEAASFGVAGDFCHQRTVILLGEQTR